MSRYRIEFTVQRAERDSDDFTEIGFGSNRVWDTTAGMPDPEEI